MNDLISRQAAIDAVADSIQHVFVEYRDVAVRMLEKVPSAEPERKTGEWIPFTSHEPDAEEKEMYPDYDCILDGPLPEDGQRILVTITCAGHERVQADEFYSDDGCYLDSGYELVTEAVAWMPLPRPYAERRIDDL